MNRCYGSKDDCCCSAVQSCPALPDPMDCSTPGLPVLHCILELFKLMSFDVVMSSNHLILCCPLLLLPSISPRIRVFSKKSVLHTRWTKCWSSSREYPGLISFRMDWLDLLAVQGTLKSLLQHDSSKASILWHSAFFTVQHTSIHEYWKKNIALTILTLSAKWCLCFLMCCLSWSRLFFQGACIF